MRHQHSLTLYTNTQNNRSTELLLILLGLMTAVHHVATGVTSCDRGRGVRLQGAVCRCWHVLSF